MLRSAIRPTVTTAVVAVFLAAPTAQAAELQKPERTLTVPAPVQSFKKLPPPERGAAQAPATGPDERARCRFTVYRVDQRAVAGGDGSAVRPFRQIGEALARGPAPRGCGVHVSIAAGAYIENLTVTGPTVLRGAAPDASQSAIVGTIRNHVGTTLTIEHLALRRAGQPGAVVVEHPSARTVIRDVTVDHATRYGVYQRGGSLEVANSIVQGTESGPVSPAKKAPRVGGAVRVLGLAGSAASYGTGIFVTGGALVQLDDVTLRLNHQGLVADGAGTRVRADRLVADHHRGNTALSELMCASTIRNGFAAVEVRNGALLYLENAQMRNNEVFGLSVHHGGRAFGRDVSIQRTHPPEACAAQRSGGGINVSVRHGGAELELLDFDLGYASLVGFQLVNAHASLSHGEVHHNVIGVHLNGLPETQSFDCLTDDVRFVANTRNLDADRLPVPEAGPPLGGEPAPPPSCVHVPWR